MTNSHVRRLVRTAPAGLLLALLGLGPAVLADTPPDWEDFLAVSGFQFLLVLFLIPLALFIVITVLASLPGLMHPGTGKSDIVTRASDAEEPHHDANQH